MARRSSRVLGLLLLASACRLAPHAPPAPRVPPDTPRLTALLVNGGGSVGANYWSHLRHLRAMRDVLLAAGVPDDRIWILAGDGEDPAPDLSQRRPSTHEGDWLLGGGRFDRLLGAKTEQVSSAIPGVHLGRADRAGVAAWFRDVGAGMAPGDTLLLFVTDHGTKNAADPTDNRITLWGRGEAISVRELRELVDGHVAPAVRVVTLMSQCYSGSFAHLAPLDPDTASPRPTCGYFSTTPARRAFGCYPEAAEDEDRGHAIRLAAALGETGALPAAHEAVLVWDDTPDVPLRTSDVYLERLLEAAAAAGDRPLATLADEELARAFSEAGRWEPTLRLLDRIASHYGLFSPRRLAELDERTTALRSLSQAFASHRNAWRATRASAADANVARWLDVAGTEWRERLDQKAVQSLPAPARAGLRSDVLAALDADADRHRDTRARLRRLDDVTVRAEEVTYRTEIRLGVLLRMRQLLLRIAGESLLARAGTPAERQRYRDLLACETLYLDPAPRAAEAVAAPAPPLPSFTDDEALARSFLPSWLGVKFQRPPDAVAQAGALAPGAAFVSGVFEHSAAARAGIRPGDVILGPPDAPFREPDQIREWTMLSARDTAAPLRILRAGRTLDVAVHLQPYPTEFPTLPAPPGPGDPAPPLSVEPYRGRPPATLAAGRQTLLFFWATWCGYCKAALPALEGLARERDLDLVAVTDESPQLLDDFFASHAGYFPDTVVVDAVRTTFLAYGVNGMPTFVLVGPDGRILQHHRGYDRKIGLPF